MKRFGIVILSVFIAAFCLTACGPTMSFSGTFVREMNDRTCTITLSSNGTFKFVRKFKHSSGLAGDPVDNDTNNIRSGKFVVYEDINEATFSYSYYDPASGQTLKGSAKGTLSEKDGKIVLSMNGTEINGQYTKK